MPQAVQAQDIYSSQQRPASATTSMNHHRVGSGNSLFSKTNVATRSSLPSTSDSKALNIASTQSPVMHETLTVIDEHMNDLNPQHNSRTQQRRDTMSSMYSSHPGRMSYIAGHETEDEESATHTEAEVMNWSPDRVAEYLEDHGVERAHCGVFREQEITGEVLLAMDQSSLFMKEFDLGLVGRRLRTWHKVKALQDEVRKGSPRPPTNIASPTTTGAIELPADEIPRNRSASVASAAVPPLRNSGGPQSYGTSSIVASPAMSRSNSATSHGIGLATTLTPQDTSYRPSAQVVRTMQHWRHSSIDSNDKTSSHKKQDSLGQQSQTNEPSSGNTHNASIDNTSTSNHREGLFSSPVQATLGDLDKGYFSSNEVDSRNRTAKTIQKRQNSTSISSAHSRNGSFIMYKKNTTQDRTASTESLHDPIMYPRSPGPSSPNSFFKKGSFRKASITTPEEKIMVPVGDSGPPVVTKLDYSADPSVGATTSPVFANNDSSSPANTPQSSSKHMPFMSKTSKLPGMRAISDAVTRSEKTSAANVPATLKESEVSSPTKDGMSTPSTGAPSFDMKNGSRASTGSANAIAPQIAPRKPRAKTKKSTSAYTRGLEKKTPAEQMVGCDYSGWMKKKSGSLMSAWKPRLFVLRGRRLSYYYSEDDTEEKGLIDISFHNVMPAMGEKLVGIHAAVTGASGTGAPSSPRTDAPLVTAAQQDRLDHPPKDASADDNLFIFKLTPPKSGRGVNFTKPTVHYFAVNSRQEGRLWMAALMKAVIDRDQDAVVTTTYNQKTISLARARAERTRPPAFQEEVTDSAPDTGEKGLGIGVGSPGTNGVSVLGGADGNERSYLMEDGSSVAPSTVPTTAPSVVTDLSFDIEKEQLAKLVQ